MYEPSQAVRSLLLRELRAAVLDRNAGGADPGQLTADLERRLRRVAELRGDPPVLELHRRQPGGSILDVPAGPDGIPSDQRPAGHTILWLCPFRLGIDPPESLRPNVRTIAKHSDHDVSSWLETVGELVVDAVVIDVSAVRGLNYDPAVIAELLVARCARPPRYLVAVVKHGSDDPISAQYAFAHEIHLLWGRSPQLVIEEGVLYYLEAVPADQKNAGAGRPAGPKQQQVGQIRRWSEIASRSADLVVGELSAEPVDRSSQAVALVLSMCDRRRGAPHFRLSPAQCVILCALADSRPDVYKLVEKTGYALAAVRTALRGIANGFNPDPATPRNRERQDRAMSFCAELARDYAPWLRSLERRRWTA